MYFLDLSIQELNARLEIYANEQNQAEEFSEGEKS